MAKARVPEPTSYCDRHSHYSDGPCTRCEEDAQKRSWSADEILDLIRDRLRFRMDYESCEREVSIKIDLDGERLFTESFQLPNAN